MDRQIVYPGAIPLETDLLNTNKYTMIGLAKLASAIMGTSTYVRGLTCTPSSPASMVVNISAGEIYSLQNIDGTAYSSLAADTTHSILKQGILLNALTFTLTAPSTTGYSVNYLIQATYTDTDSGATVLPYYNASNPSVAWSGPNNSGAAQNTVRSGVCTVSLKAGVAATTGTQVTPSPDSGYTSLYVVTVAQGATTVTAANISTSANAPLIPSAGIVDAIQRNTLRYGVDTGSTNTYVVNINPGPSSLSAGMEVVFRANSTNTGSSTLNVGGLGAFPVINQYGATLSQGEIASGGIVRVIWSAAASSWFIQNSTNGIPFVPDMDQGNYGQQVANSKFVRDAINILIGGAPDNLNTLGELATAITNLIGGAPSNLNTLGALASAIGNNPNFSTATSQSISNLDNAKMAKSANGSDIASASAFRTNLGLLSAALRDVGTGANQIPDMSSFPLTATQTGWTKLPNGVYLQWGVTPSTTGTISASFPIAFPNACLWIGKNTYSSGSSATSTSVIEIVSPTRTGFTMSNIATLVNSNTAVAGPVSAGIAFFAIGY